MTIYRLNNSIYFKCQIFEKQQDKLPYKYHNSELNMIIQKYTYFYNKTKSTNRTIILESSKISAKCIFYQNDNEDFSYFTYVVDIYEHD